MLKNGQTHSGNTPRFLKYVCVFFDIMHESVNPFRTDAGLNNAGKH